MKNDKEILRTKKWLIVKPLTLKSSLKYGYNTKWCTSSKENPLTFYEYSKEGILIYIIERETDTKWATYWEINEVGNKKEMSWWNASDDRLDSMLVLIPEDIMDLVKKELFLEPKPNFFYLKESEKENYVELQNNLILSQEKESVIDWEIHRNDGEYWDKSTTTTTFDVDKMVNKTLEHKYISDTYLKMVKSSTKAEVN
jgi:hypothetical protein|tara:strand:+ start:2272 stop:2868 length:597 start_codon:yes stop_codon:yes gene_type:complete